MDGVARSQETASGRFLLFRAMNYANAEIQEWTLVVFDFAVAAGYIVPPWRPTDEQTDRLTGYFGVGLSPEDGAEALFGVKH